MALLPTSLNIIVIIPIIVFVLTTKRELQQVVLSQWSGSNRGGFRIVPSNTKGTIHLDGVFNIISYDVVPKLQKILAESEFKVSATTNKSNRLQFFIILVLKQYFRQGFFIARNIETRLGQ